MSNTASGTMDTKPLLQEFDRNALIFLDTLTRVRSLVPTLDQEQAERVQRGVEELRLNALAAEFRQEVPDIEPDYELLELVGVNPPGSVEEDRIRLRQVLEERFR